MELGGRVRSARQTIKVVVLDRSEPPGVPGGLVLAGSGPTSLSVGWSAPVNSGPPVSDYDVRYREDGRWVVGGFGLIRVFLGVLLLRV